MDLSGQEINELMAILCAGDASFTVEEAATIIARVGDRLVAIVGAEPSPGADDVTNDGVDEFWSTALEAL